VGDEAFIEVTAALVFAVLAAPPACLRAAVLSWSMPPFQEDRLSLVDVPLCFWSDAGGRNTATLTDSAMIVFEK